MSRFAANDPEVPEHSGAPGQTALGSRAALFLIWGIALAAPIATTLAIRRFAVNVPFADDWRSLTRLFQMFDGEITFAEYLWHQDGDHRVPFVRLIILVSVYLCRYDGAKLVYVGFALRVLTLVLLWDLLRVTLANRSRLLPILTASSSLLLFSAAQGLGWIWYYPGVQWNLAALGMVALPWALSRWPERRRGVVIAVAAALIGSLSVAGCLCLWGAGLAGLAAHGWIRSKRLPWRTLAGWSCLSTLVVFAYLAGAQRLARSFGLVLSRPGDGLTFFATTLGGGFSGMYQDGAKLAPWFGAAGLLLLIMAAHRLLRDDKRAIASAIPWLLLAGSACAVAALSTVGRLALFRAPAPHYVALSSLLWIAVFALVGILFTASWERNGGHLRLEQIVFIGVIVPALAYGYVGGYVRGERRLVDSRTAFLSRRQYLLAYRTATGEQLRALGPQPPVGPRTWIPPLVRILTRRLEEARLGPFAGRSQTRWIPGVVALDGLKSRADAPAVAVESGDTWLDLAPDPSLSAAAILEDRGGARAAAGATPSVRWVALRMDAHREDAIAARPPSDIAWRLMLPAGSIKLSTRAGIDPMSWDQPPLGDGVKFSVVVDDDAGGNDVLWSRHVDPRHNRGDRQWLPVEVDLGRYGGQTIVLRLTTGPGPGGRLNGEGAAWAKPIITVATLRR